MRVHHCAVAGDFTFPDFNFINLFAYVNQITVDALLQKEIFKRIIPLMVRTPGGLCKME